MQTTPEVVPAFSITLGDVRAMCENPDHHVSLADLKQQHRELDEKIKQLENDPCSRNSCAGEIKRLKIKKCNLRSLIDKAESEERRVVVKGLPESTRVVIRSTI